MNAIPKPIEAKTAGAWLEAAIARRAAQLEGERKMCLRKVDPPTLVMRGRIVQKASPFLDFHGVARPKWNRPARPVIIEAKATQKTALELGSRGLTQRQIDNLRMWHHAGVWCHIIVLWNEGSDAFEDCPVFVVPMTVLFVAIGLHRKSIGRTEWKPLRKTDDGLPDLWALYTGQF